eukprot:TRINITY_DN3846_c0_g1_i1.p2 TRINITY_DN3846_c0_g1~~TRINITY_DN3846_c0_g1_i1.p2  ORF type:complete len:190 (-),score=39.02 TRINITY_DN3846_c0_g1_i1:16-585(-)
MRVICTSSAEYNAVAVLAKVVHEMFGIEKGAVTVLHSLTSNLSTVDGGNGGREGRAYANIIPSPNKDLFHIGRVIPELDNKIVGVTLQVPTIGVSLIDFSFLLSQPVDFDELCSVIRSAASMDMKGLLQYSDGDCVSSDFVGDPSSCIFDERASMQLEPSFMKLVAWFDNEWAYACRVVDLVCYCTEST